MKYFKLEPSYKKSVLELTIFSRPLNEIATCVSDTAHAMLVKELGWRTGEFLITVPETDEEISTWLEDHDYDNILDFAIDHGYTVTEGDAEVMDPDTTVQTMLENILIPDLDDDYILISEDYPDIEMLSTWDGCWDDWTLRTGDMSLEEEQVESLIEEASEIFEEEYEEGVETLGWKFLGCDWEMHCKPIITPCRSYGQPLEEDEPLEDDD
jgi:hypothetical protein|tara:strand:- start:896 stop:1528 length:633 start_codon:yes stop_codon:yes gene_type:complete